MRTQKNNISVSIVIPAFNEEECIGDTLQAISSYPPGESYEVIVVDNGSDDATASIAQQYGALLVSYENATIAAVRNRGVAESRGEVLVFLDADVLVTQSWASEMPHVVESLHESPNLVTGSRCLPPETDNWFIKYWFGRLAHYEAPYINSGHLITTRKLFDQIGGFSEHLRTAEDYDFCMKAIQVSAKLKNDQSLVVIHLGYPQSLASFVTRERWHGREDFESWSSFAESKVGWAAAFNLMASGVASIAVLSGMGITPVLFYLILMSMVSIALTLYKFGSSDRGVLWPTALVFYFYLCGRSLALIDRLTNSRK